MFADKSMSSMQATVDCDNQLATKTEFVGASRSLQLILPVGWPDVSSSHLPIRNTFVSLTIRGSIARGLSTGF